MKKILFIAFLLTSFVINAQSFQGKAIYKTHRKVDMKIGGKNSTINDAQKAQFEAMMKKQFQKTFVLTFDKNSSIYKEEKKLSAPAGMPVNGMKFMVMESGGGSDVYYKNTKKNSFVNKTEIMGKRFLIKDKLPKYDWKLTSETKNIGIYTCYKATYTREIERTNMTVEDGEVKEKKEKVDVVTTAWYTPTIPVSNGPGSYAGLPGLILEIHEGKQTIICSEIVMNPTNKIKIEEPKKGKKVSQKQYEKIMAKKSKEMMDKFKSRRNNKGNNVEIRIGG
jgi:GLPGLI family protein